MPAGTSTPNRCIPRRLRVRLRLFPKSEVTSVFLLVLVCIDALATTGNVSGKIDLGKFAVIRKRGNAVID
jgi:hypothetical protein